MADNNVGTRSLKSNFTYGLSHEQETTLGGWKRHWCAAQARRPECYSLHQSAPIPAPATSRPLYSRRLRPGPTKIAAAPCFVRKHVSRACNFELYAAIAVRTGSRVTRHTET